MFVIAIWLMELVAVAPCQCFTPGGVQITSPGLTSRFSPPSSCTQPVPEVTIRIWPAGWLCHAERAPGSKVTCPAERGVWSGAPNWGASLTEPVKFVSAPLPDGREPFGKTCMPCAAAGPAAARVSAIADAMICFMVRPLLVRLLSVRPWPEGARSLGLHHHLDRLAFVHGAVAIGHA